MADLNKDVEALDRVLFRLASVDDDRLLQILQSLLPQLLVLHPHSVSTPLEQQLKEKVLRAVSHIKTRLGALHRPALPLDALCQVLQQSALSVVSHNLAFLFLEMGFDAASTEQQTRVLAAVVQIVSRLSAPQQETFFRLLVRALPVTASVVFPRTEGAAGGKGDQREAEMTLNSDVIDHVNDGDDANINVVLDFILDLVLYEPPNLTRTNATTAFGLMTPRLERLQRVKISQFDREVLYRVQLDALRLVKEMTIPTGCKIPVYLAGSACFHHAVKDFSNEQLSRVIKLEEKELEDADVARRLMALVLGSQVAQCAGAFEGASAIMLADRTRLADASILQALTLLSASTAATNVQPLMLQLLCHLMFGTDPSRPLGMASKIKLASVQLCQWTFHHCHLSLLEGLLGPVLCPSLLRSLMDTELEASDASCLLEFRQGVYGSMSVLASRGPTIVATSEQAFQVLLVRCFVEEEHRTGAGAHALKAFASLAGAYTEGSTLEVRAKVIQELVAILKSSKLYDSSKNYVRVRRAVATWCAELLIASVPEQYDVALRLSVMRLDALDDEDTRRSINKALFSEPLPSAAALVQTLRATFIQKDLKTSMHDRAAESCVRFCVEVLKASQDSSSQVERSCVVEYITHTLFGQSEQNISAAVRSSSIFETAATALMELCEFDAKSVSAVLSNYAKDLFDVVDVGQDRMFRTNIAAIVAHTIRAEALTVSQIVSEFIVVGMARLDRCSLENQLLGVVYVLSGVLSCIDSDTMVNTASEDELQLILLCFRKMVDLFHCKVKEGSIFALYPTSDLAQNEHMAILRSLMDGVGLSGTLKSLMRSSVSAEWSLLKAKVLQDLGTVIGWKLDGAYLDDRVAPKLVAVKKIAIENVGRVVSGLPGVMSADLLSGVEAVLDALFDLDVETDVELQFDVGEVLVALGTHDFEETFAVDRQAKYDVFAANRAATIFERVVNEHAESRQPKKRRIAAVWLLCMCAAGLTTSSRNDGRTVAYATSWAGVFCSSAYSRSILSVHEFFVTMLNDANEVSKECAVKGLACLRLHSPTDEMGAQFSESLFRRLRCFRAFVSSSDVVDDADDGGQAVDHRREEGRFTAAIPSSSSGSVIENAAYREVSNVAADVGDPELMYALLYLSTKDPIWESIATSNASRPMLRPDMFSFVTTDEKFRASVIAKAGTQWMAEDYSSKTKLAPWLFLLKFHPHSKVAAVMSNLWEFAKGNSATVATATGEKALLRQHWPLFFQFTLARLENDRNFKYRVAACLALVDLLNGAEADDVRENFLRLWICASRAVDDVVEAVAVAGVKLYRYLGEVSLRIALSDTACSSLLVKFLAENGIVSKSSVCRALSIDVLIRLVKTLEAHDIQDRLAPLLLKLLEYLSSLEMPELQYAQFHVEKKDQLERLRVSVSQAGPVGQLLNLATVRLKELAGSTDCFTVVGELARGVANLLKFGVGLNTRVGTANFVITLAGELPFELRKCNGAELLLRRVLIPYVGMKTAGENDQYGDEESRYGGTSGSASIDGGDSSLAATSGLADGLVIQSYCRAAAYLCPLVDAGTVRDYVRRGIFACSTFGQSSSNTSSSSPSQLQDDVDMEADETENVRLKSHQVFTSRFLLISALAMKELVKKVPPIADAGTVVIDDMRNTWYCTHVFPAAFIGQFAAADALKSSWKTVLDELPPTVLYASRSLDAVLQAIALLLAHPAWDTRRQAARALQAIFASATYCSKLSVEQAERIWCELIDAVPGRLWRGKGVILESIVSLAAFKMETRATDTDEEWTNKLSLLLAEECARAWKNQDLAYLESAIVNLGKLSALLPAEQSDLRCLNVCSLRSMLAEWMTGNAMESSESSWPALPPLLIKCVFEALSLMWPPLAATQGTAGIEDIEISAETLLWLCASVESPHLAAWSVRRAIFQTLAAVADRAPLKALADSNGVAERMVDSCCGSFGVADGKYSMVRVAAAGALVPLLKRAADTSNLALRLVVQCERMVEAVQTLSTSEEASEQQAAFNLKSQLSLMP